MNYNFPTDTTILDIINEIYNQLKLKIKKNKIHTKQMLDFLNNNFKINPTKVVDYYNKEATLNLAFYKAKIIDKVNPKIDERLFQDESKSINDFNDEVEYEQYCYELENYHNQFYQFFHEEGHDYRYNSPPNYDIWIPNFLLQGKPKFIVDYIFSRYFERTKFDGEKFQKRIGMIRFRSLRLDEKTEMRDKIINLRSKNKKISHQNHQIHKGKIISKFFGLLGFANTLIRQKANSNVVSNLFDDKE